VRRVERGVRSRKSSGSVESERVVKKKVLRSRKSSRVVEKRKRVCRKEKEKESV